MSGLPGVDLDALTAWLDSTAPGLRRGSLSGVRIAGGMSNLTLRITDGTTTWALRRPPLGQAGRSARGRGRGGVTPTEGGVLGVEREDRVREPRAVRERCDRVWRNAHVADMQHGGTCKLARACAGVCTAAAWLCTSTVRTGSGRRVRGPWCPSRGEKARAAVRVQATVRRAQRARTHVRT